MNAISNFTNYIKNLYVIQTASSYATKASSVASSYFLTKKPDEVLPPYVDKTESGKVISSTTVRYHYPKPSHRSFQHHESLDALCIHIAQTRNPRAEKKLLKEAYSASFSSINRGDISTEVTLSKSLKRLLGLDGWTDQKIKDFFKTESIYKHNSQFNGHSYTAPNGKVVEIDSAISSSADRKAPAAQNLTVVRSGGQNLLYTGRPDVPEKAKEQALFILSHKLNIPLLEEADPLNTPSTEMPGWIKGKKGITWNADTHTIEFPYVVYSIMSDSSLQSAYYRFKKDPAANEKLFLQKEKITLEGLKKGPILVKDASGKVFKVQCTPIFLSQAFNAFDTFKGFVGEGSLSPAITNQGWNEISQILKEHPVKMKKLQKHIDILNSYFSGAKYLSNLHLFLHLNIIISALNKGSQNLPTVLHCKSSTDRTGIGAALITCLKQFERLGIPISSDMNVLTKDVRFKELFYLNWIPTWHQRSKFSRDVEGISFGKNLGQNPILLEVLPKRFLDKPETSIFHSIHSSLFSQFNALGLRIYTALNVDPLLSFSLINKKMSPEEFRDKMAIVTHSNMQRKQLSYLPSTYLNARVHKFRSQSKHFLSPLEKQQKPWLMFK